jgi:hypothetical protein
MPQLTRVVIYFRTHSTATEHLNNLADHPPTGAERFRILTPRNLPSLDMSTRTKVILLGILAVAVASIIAGVLLQ